MGFQPSELTTFGAVLRFAIEMESRASDFHRDAAGVAEDPRVREIFSVLSKEHGRRKDLLERARREKLNEMILEPMSNIDGNDYWVEAKSAWGKDFGEVLRVAVELEDRSSAFYRDVAQRGKSMFAEVGKIFVKLSQENIGYALKLRPLQDAPF